MSHGYWDIHNHLLPGVDDGCFHMEETYELLREEYKQGIRNIIFTPHFRPGMFQVSALEREQVYEETCSAMQKEFPDMQFHLGCEYFAHEEMLEDFHDIRCRMAGTKIVLLEFSTTGHFSHMESVVFDVLKAGYQPILAHAERYRCLYQDAESVHCLKKKGAMIQINADSILGKEGMAQKRFCYKLLTDNIVDFVASDAHDPVRRPVRIKACMHKIKRRFGAEQAENIFSTTPTQLFGDQNRLEKDYGKHHINRQF